MARITRPCTFVLTRFTARKELLALAAFAAVSVAACEKKTVEAPTDTPTASPAPVSPHTDAATAEALPAEVPLVVPGADVPTNTTPPDTALTTPTASTSGTVLRKTALRTKPYLDAPVTTTITTGSSVGILKRSGGWLQVKSGGSTGWVRMLDVRTGHGGSATSASVIGKGTVQLATGRAGSGNVVATSGIRGLDEEELTHAEADLAQLEKLKGYAMSETTARNWAKAVGLKTHIVATLPAPGTQP
jgi:hypothetical protein